MIALELAEYRTGCARNVVIPIQDGIGLRVGPAPSIENLQIVKGSCRDRQFIDSIACRLASSATDTPGRIEQDTETPGMAFKFSVVSGTGRLSENRANPNGPDAEKRSS
jgi:hypothetical protein